MSLATGLFDARIIGGHCGIEASPVVLEGGYGAIPPHSESRIRQQEMSINDTLRLRVLSLKSVFQVFQIKVMYLFEGKISNGRYSSMTIHS